MTPIGRPTPALLGDVIPQGISPDVDDLEAFALALQLGTGRPARREEILALAAWAHQTLCAYAMLELLLAGEVAVRRSGDGRDWEWLLTGSGGACHPA